MTCYLINRGGEPVAFVADLATARAIVQCQPWGEYLVEPLEIGEPIPVRRLRPRRRQAGVLLDTEENRSSKHLARRRPGFAGRTIDPRPHPVS